MQVKSDSPKRLFGNKMTDGTRRDGHHVRPDGRQVKHDKVKFVMLLHMYGAVLTKKVNAKYILLLLPTLLQQRQIEYFEPVMNRKERVGGTD